jgi:hypothetical protein
LLHPAANRGVQRVSGSFDLLPGPCPFPAPFLPLEGFHSTSAVPCHQGPCLPGVDPPRCSRLQGSRCRSRLSARLPRRARLQGFALSSSPYHLPSFPPADGLPSRGLFDPLQDPSFERHQLSPVIPDGRPVRLRGSVSVPIVPASTSATAAPRSEPETVRPRVREYASLRYPPRRRDPSRYEPPSTANAVLVGRHVHRGQAASSLTPGGLASLAGCASSRCCHRHRQARALRPSDTRRYRSVRAPRLIAVAGEG